MVDNGRHGSLWWLETLHGGQCGRQAVRPGLAGVNVVLWLRLLYSPADTCWSGRGRCGFLASSWVMGGGRVGTPLRGEDQRE